MAPAASEAAPGPDKPAKLVAVYHCAYPPISFTDSNTGRASGFFVDVMDALAFREGLQVQYTCRKDWPAMLDAVEKGEADVGVLLRSEEREKRLLFSEPIDTSYLSFFARSQSSIDAERVPAGYKIAVIKGSMSHEQLRRRAGLNLHTLDSYQMGLFSLLAGEVDLFAGEESTILKVLREIGLDDRIRKVGRPFVERQRCLAVRKGDVRLLATLNKALSGFVGSSEYQKIYLRWFGAPTPYWTTRRIMFASALFLLLAVSGMALWRYQSITRINRELLSQIAERRRAEEALRSAVNTANEERARTEAIIAAMGDAVSIQNTNYVILYQNQVSRDIYGDHVGEFCYRAYQGSERVCGRCHLTMTFDDGLIHKMVQSRTTEQGTRFFDITASPVRDAAGTIVAGIELVREVTERRQSEAALIKRERQLAESQRIAHIGSWEHNLKTGQVFWSDELFRLLGLDPHSDPADIALFFDRVHPDDQPALQRAVQETLAQKRPFSIDYRFVLPGGATRILHAQAELIPDEAGEHVILSGTGQDITEQKAAEDSLRSSEQFIRNILDTVDEGFIVVDRDYRILTANKAYCMQVGGCDGSIVGRKCHEVSHQSDRPCHEAGEDCAVSRVFRTGEPASSLHRHVDAQGAILFVETKAFPIRDGAGDVTSVIETINNITEKHLLEEERLKSQKLEAIGTLAGGIAHDFNNLLQGVFGYISMAKMKLADRDRAHAMLDQAEQALHISVNLTSQLLTFSKGGKPRKKTVVPRSVIESGTRFALSGSSVDYRLRFDDDLWAVEADEGQLGQVIQNIVLNADQAMPEGGTVFIEARNISAPAADQPRLPAGNHVEISIRDSGIGIPQQYLQKIFDPYFTTKEKGSGLGLATSYSIIRNHGGHIDVISRPGEGATFRIFLPAAGVQPVDRKAPGESPSARRGRVLVMDDEQLILNITGEMIRALGHEVTVAEHGEAAIESYLAARESGRPFDVVILDLTIRGGMGGRETLERLRSLDPEVRAIVSSGYSDDAVVSDHGAYGFRARLTKPYKIEGLRDTLNQVLGA